MSGLIPIDKLRSDTLDVLFEMVTVSIDSPFGAIIAGEKAAPSATLETSLTLERSPTLSAAVADAPLVARCVVDNALAATVFNQLPRVELVTDTVIVQLALTDTLPLVSATVELPAIAATVPAPHVVEAFWGAGNRDVGRQRSAERQPRKRCRCRGAVRHHNRKSR